MIIMNFSRNRKLATNFFLFTCTVKHLQASVLHSLRFKHTIAIKSFAHMVPENKQYETQKPHGSIVHRHCGRYLYWFSVSYKICGAFCRTFDCMCDYRRHRRRRRRRRHYVVIKSGEINAVIMKLVEARKRHRLM